jgi:hypothetical protein
MAASIKKWAAGKGKKPKLGTGDRFEALSEDLSEKGVDDPDALAAAIGRKKYGAEAMAKMSAAGRKKG